MKAFPTTVLSPHEQRLGEQLLEDVRSLPSLNAFLFNHLRHLLLPAGMSHPLPLYTKINTTKVVKDGRALELYMGILFHCMGYRILECGGGRGDGGVDVKVESPDGSTIVLQCKQYSRAIVGSDVGHQLIGTMFVNECNTGLLVSCSNVSKDVKMLSRVLKTVRGGEFTVHIWEGDVLVRMFGLFGERIVEKRAQMLADAASNSSLRQYLSSTIGDDFCIMHSLSSSHRCQCETKPLSMTKQEQNYSDQEKTQTPVVTTMSAGETEVNEEGLEPVSDSDDGEEDGQCKAYDVDSCRPCSSNVKAAPRAQMKWTKEEEHELRRGVDKWGEGSWTEILSESAVMRANGKTNIKIRDKWKNMERREIRAMTPRKGSGAQATVYTPITVRF